MNFWQGSSKSIRYKSKVRPLFKKTTRPRKLAPKDEFQFRGGFGNFEDHMKKIRFPRFWFQFPDFFPDFVSLFQNA